MKRRLNIAVGLLHEPKIIFMDEPTVGIDPQSRRRILDTIKELNRLGMSVLYTTHYMEEAEELSHRIGIIDHGKLIAEGAHTELTPTVGEYDIVHLQVDTSDNGVESSVVELQKLAKVHQVVSEKGQLTIQTQDANAVLPDVLNHLQQSGVRVKSLEIQEPNLEAVFLHLTGRALRD